MKHITSMQKAQATEYLVQLGVVLVIATAVIGVLIWPVGSTKDVKQSTFDIHAKIAAMEFPDLLQGFLAYYKFDEGSGTTAADNRGGITATLYGAPAYVSGKSNTAISLNGADQYARTSNSFSTTNGATLMAWINAANPTNCGVTSCTIMMFGNGWSTGHWFRTNGASLTFEYYNGTDRRIFSPSLSIPSGTWMHVAATHDYGANTVTIYANGTQIYSTTNTDPIVKVSNGPLRIGTYAAGGSYLFNGTIDEVLIFNRALSANEIRFLYENPGYPN